MEGDWGGDWGGDVGGDWGGDWGGPGGYGLGGEMDYGSFGSQIDAETETESVSGTFGDLASAIGTIVGGLAFGAPGAAIGNFLGNAVSRGGTASYGAETESLADGGGGYIERTDFVEPMSGLQYQTINAENISQKTLEEKVVQVDQDKVEFLEKPAQILSAGPLSQTGSYGYPYIAIKQAEPAPLITMPILLIGAGIFYFFLVRR
ncbi:hypothetical protein ES702_06356 [subsurface metagenome]